MPGTDSRPSRRASKTNGISKNYRKKHSNTTHSKQRPLIQIKAFFNHAQPSNITNDCLAISRSCTASPAPKHQLQIPLNQSCPPPSVVLFFDYLNGNSPAQRSHEEAARYVRSLSHDMSLARSKLQRLLPSQEDVRHVSEYATKWMSLYHGLYTLTYTFRTGFQLEAMYSRMHNAEVHPVLLAMYLLCFAISLQQAPANTTVGDSTRHEFVTQVCDVVEEVVVRKSVLAGTVEGLETCMLLLMLAVGRNDLTIICLTLERLIALADLMGLPKAGYEQATRKSTIKNDPHHMAKLQIWEAICATDRNFGMMLKLSACTTSSMFPLHKLSWSDGKEISQSYNYHLARVCGMVIAIEKAYSNEEPELESYKKVIAADHALATLASLVPKTWSQDNSGKIEDLIVKFWHRYITFRVHLRPALIAKDEYKNSRRIARLAGLDALRMFCAFRTILPIGFFYCRVLDIQAFTVAVLLQLLKDEDNMTFATQQELVNRTIGSFKVVSVEFASSFARKAVASLSQLQGLVQGGIGPMQSTVHIPLLGNVSIRRRNQPSQHDSGMTGGNMGIPGIHSAASLEQSAPTSSSHVLWSIDFENDSPWTPPASRAGGSRGD